MIVAFSHTNQTLQKALFVFSVCKNFPFIFLSPARKYESGEYLNITGITRDQAGDYECSALNDIASPDTKTVKVTVNCKYVSFFSLCLHVFFNSGLAEGIKDNLGGHFQ